SAQKESQQATILGNSVKQQSIAASTISKLNEHQPSGQLSASSANLEKVNPQQVKQQSPVSFEKRKPVKKTGATNK
ncbi:MAG: hypothetical protein ABI729_08845, partial [Chitinophagales bacterium]